MKKYYVAVFILFISFCFSAVFHIREAEAANKSRDRKLENLYQDIDAKINEAEKLKDAKALLEKAETQYNRGMLKDALSTYGQIYDLNASKGSRSYASGKKREISREIKDKAELQRKKEIARKAMAQTGDALYERNKLGKKKFETGLTEREKRRKRELDLQIKRLNERKREAAKYIMLEEAKKDQQLLESKIRNEEIARQKAELDAARKREAEWQDTQKDLDELNELIKKLKEDSK